MFQTTNQCIYNVNIYSFCSRVYNPTYFTLGGHPLWNFPQCQDTPRLAPGVPTLDDNVGLVVQDPLLKVQRLRIIIDI